MSDEEFDFERAEDNIVEPDPAMVAHLDQEQAAFEEMADEFLETFGFYHKCSCAEDYSAGRMVEVTECFAEMVGEALETCLRQTAEIKLMNSMLQKMFEVVNRTEDVDAEPEQTDGEKDN